MTILARDEMGASIQALYWGAKEAVAIGAGSLQSAVTADNVEVVRLKADSACYILQGVNPVVSAANGTPLPAGVVEYIRVKPGERLAVIQDGAGSGNLHITNCGN